MKSLTFCFFLLMIFLVYPSAGLAEKVGYVKILNGADISTAFVVERQGRVITPKGLYTELEAEDAVKPSSEALLFFFPYDVACEALEIKGEFKARACPVKKASTKDTFYDFMTNEFLAAPEESQDIFVTRTFDFYSLLPRALRLYVEDQSLAESLKKTPFLALTSQKSQAEALLMGHGPVKLLFPGGNEGRQFNLPVEEPALRQYLLNRINFQTMISMVSPVPWPEVEWSINIHAPAKGGTLEYDGYWWDVVKRVQVKAGQTVPIPVQEPCVLTFTIVNRGLTPYYAYLINYTEEGQIQPFWGPSPEASMTPKPNLNAGQKISLGNMKLISPREYMRLIVSEVPLDLSSFSQENLEPQVGSTVRAVRLRPVPEHYWATLAHVFELK